MEREREQSVIPRWREPRQLLTWPEEMERFFGRSMPWRGFGHRPWGWWDERWVPEVDVFEEEGKIVVRADLPGMKLEDIEVTLEWGTLTIRGRRQEAKEVKEEDYYCSERATGEFSRSIGLPQGIKEEDIQAKYQNGVLEISIPRPGGHKARKVNVQGE